MATFDTIIQHGTIVDGTRVPRYRADHGPVGGTAILIPEGRRMRAHATESHQ